MSDDSSRTAWNQLQEFVRDASPANWLEYGEELHDSAELLWRHESEGLRVEVQLHGDEKRIVDSRRTSEISRSYMLLAGFALENVIKGLLVAADSRHVNTGALSGDLKSHDLNVLASKLSAITLSLEERNFCLAASKAIPYWGRYPIPLNSHELMPSVAVTEDVRRVFIGLFQRLASKLYWAIRDGWDSGVGPKTLTLRNKRYGDRIDPANPLT